LTPLWVDFVGVALASGLVGASELVERFRDEPLRALRTRPALLYVVLNGVAAVVALLLIRAFDFTFGTDANGRPLRLTQAIAAGFGAVVFLRSAVFVVSQQDESDKAYGPGLLFERFLRAAVERIDRVRAIARDKEIDRAMKDLSFEEAVEALPPLVVGFLPNAADEARRKLEQAVDDLRASDLRSEVKLRLLGHAVLFFGGSGVLKKATEDLRKARASG
jgi:hypothetical protein